MGFLRLLPSAPIQFPSRCRLAVPGSLLFALAIALPISVLALKSAFGTKQWVATSLAADHGCNNSGRDA